jgi:hypothetical protein
MTHYRIRLATRPNGDIEAAVGLGVEVKCLTIDPRTGEVTHSDIHEGAALFRQLVRAARAEMPVPNAY